MIIIVTPDCRLRTRPAREPGSRGGGPGISGVARPEPILAFKVRRFPQNGGESPKFSTQGFSVSLRGFLLLETAVDIAFHYLRNPNIHE